VLGLAMRREGAALQVVIGVHCTHNFSNDISIDPMVPGKAPCEAIYLFV
jgi:hypothetical protein